MEQITEQKLKNKRFRITEEKIILALISIQAALSTSRLIKIAGISRSTLYRHHKNIYAIVPNYQKYIMRKYQRFIKRLLRLGHLDLKKIYIQIFIFIYRYQKIIGFLYNYGKLDLTEDMVRLLKPKITAVYKLSNEEVFEIYAREVAYYVSAWQLGGFDKNEISTTLNKIIYLTETIPARLGSLAGRGRSTG